jgi:hypothetical protein
MSAFEIPDPAPEVPAELQTEIDASVRRFEEELGGMFVLAKMNGWLEKYRKEVTALSLKSYQMGGPK